MSNKKKTEEKVETWHTEALVPVGHDYRGKERQIKKSDTTAPDGIAGKWS